jgi:hypothetical protein
MIKRTFTELKRELRRIDEITLMEVLEVTSEDLLRAFASRIPARRKQLQELIDDTDYDVFEDDTDFDYDTDKDDYKYDDDVCGDDE